MTEPQPSIDEQIGKRLRRLRQRLGDRQIDFATRIGRERSTVAKYERGQRSLSLADICLLYTSPSPRDRTRSRMPSSA